MKVANVLLADAAIANPDGKLYVLGGGISTITPPQFPYTHPMLALAIALEFAPFECGRLHKTEVRFVDSDGKELTPTLAQQIVPQRNPADPTLPSGTLTIFNYMQLPFTKPGDNAFSIIVDGTEVASLPLRVFKINQAKAA